MKKSYKTIKNREDYQKVLSRISKLMNAEANTPEREELGYLVTLVGQYEEKEYPIEPPDPSVSYEE